MRHKFIESPYQGIMDELMTELLKVVKDKAIDAEQRVVAAKVIDDVNDTELRKQFNEEALAVRREEIKDMAGIMNKGVDAMDQVAKIEKKRDHPVWMDDEDDEE